MNGEDYKVISEIVSERGYTVEPEPKVGENVRFFDIVAGEGEIPTGGLLNTIHAVVHERQLGIAPEVIAAHPHRVTFEDILAG
jgi:hypothetical protein